MGFEVSLRSLFINTPNLAEPDQIQSAKKTEVWIDFLEKNKFDTSSIEKIDMSSDCPVIFDKAGNKFSIDFNKDKQNYAKKKISIKKELISRALGAGKYGLRILDLTAGLGIDAVFLAQLGYSVVSLERNPLIYLALTTALEKKPDLDLKIIFNDAYHYLKEQPIHSDVIYFDPMFPEKNKSALPRQEMVFFRNLVGADEDALNVLREALLIRSVKRVVVKRSIKAPVLLKPQSEVKGKLVRFDLYAGAYV